MKILFVCLAGLALAGCVTAQERQARYLANGRAACEAAGYRPGSADMANCVMMQVRSSEAAHERATIELSRQLQQLANPPRQPVTWCNQTITGVVCTTQ